MSAGPQTAAVAQAVQDGPGAAQALAVPRVDVARRLFGVKLEHAVAVVSGLILVDAVEKYLPWSGLHLGVLGRLLVGAASLLLVAVPIRGRSVAQWALALAVFALTPRRTRWRPGGPPRPVVVRRRGGAAAAILGWLLWGLSYLPLPTPASWAGVAVTADEPETAPPPPRRTFGPKAAKSRTRARKTSET